MTADIVFTVALVFVGASIAAVTLTVMALAVLAGSVLNESVRRAFMRRSALGYPPDGGSPQYVVISADGRRTVVGRPNRTRPAGEKRPPLAVGLGVAR